MRSRTAVTVSGPASPKRTRRVTVRRALTLFVAAVVAVALVTVGTIGWLGSERAIHPHQAIYPWTLGRYPDLKPREVAFVSQTRIRIVGRFFPGPDLRTRRHATIVLSHGYGDNQNQMLPWADFLHRAGYNVFTYDMRDRGGSGGTAVTLGSQEQYDLISAVAYLRRRPDVDPSRIGALGVSLGGSVTILAAARDRYIRAVVDDCGFSAARSVIDSSFEHFVGLPAFPFSAVTIAFAQLRSGTDVGRIRPVDVVGRISPRPIFFIHGLADRAVPPENSARNFAAARQPKQIWWVPRAPHWHSLLVAHAEYVRRVVAFFRTALGA